ncbi:PREDICTED: solute carrier family 22 member 16 [Odobenus rosmarus divergens]|uniref:Solute carrier family 22 member 16 n=1 Tax=Odobenus rosmarus divergens TaxID=9708 RepID=A0A2U3WDY8_ODORO|nr:PREDICTED: solute carrier family 22 member 16 [Odobenus rosmarus divergens]
MLLRESVKREELRALGRSNIERKWEKEEALSDSEQQAGKHCDDRERERERESERRDHADAVRVEGRTRRRGGSGRDGGLPGPQLTRDEAAAAGSSRRLRWRGGEKAPWREEPARPRARPAPSGARGTQTAGLPSRGAAGRGGAERGALPSAPGSRRARRAQLGSAVHGGTMRSHNFELIFDRVGHFGRFQIVLYFICAFQNISCGIHYLASVFMTVSPYHTCRPPGNVSQVLFHNISSWRLEDIWILFFTGHEDQIIVQLQNGEVWELTSCHRFRRDEKSGLNSDYNGQKSSFPCLDGYIYDKSKWDSTVVTQWDLVCNREWFAKMVQPVFMLGVLLGAMIFGYLSDRLGRRLVLWSTSTGIFFFGIAVAFSSDYYSFMIARFLLAMSGSGYLVVVFVYVTEFIGMKSRTWACIQMHSFFAIGTMVVALTGYFVRTWWTYQIVLSTVTVPFVMCCWILPETPFWLLSEGRYEEAQRVVDMMAKWNRASSCKLSELLSLDLNGPVGNEPFEVKKHNLLDLFYDWNVGTRTLIVWLIWFTGCLGFYFFSLNSVNLGGNEYLNLFLMGAVEIPAYVFICWGMDSIGRRNVLVFSLISGGLLCGVVMVIPKDYFVWTVVVTMAGKFAIGASFGLIYLYTAELYPTMVRSLAVGSGSMVSRVGSIAAPFWVSLSSTWTFLPQLLVGILAFISGVLSLMLPETMGMPLATTWEEAAKQDTEKESSGKLSPTTKNTALEKMEVIDSGVSGLGE